MVTTIHLDVGHVWAGTGVATHDPLLELSLEHLSLPLAIDAGAGTVRREGVVRRGDGVARGCVCGGDGINWTDWSWSRGLDWEEVGDQVAGLSWILIFFPRLTSFLIIFMGKYVCKQHVHIQLLKYHIFHC